MNDKKKLLTDMFQYKELPMKNSPNILLFNIPCEGYGDVIFAFKLSSYLIEWYNAKITIATINTDAYSKLGLSSPNIKIHKLIKGITSSSKCRYLKGLSFVSNEVFDLIFVAPRTEKDPILSDVKSVIPYSNLFNTYFFSEYTTKYEEPWFYDYDFPTGIDSDCYGLLLTPFKMLPRPINLPNPYIFIYISKVEEYKAKNCLMSFMQMIDIKYKNVKRLEIVAPAQILGMINKKLISKLKYFKLYNNDDIKDSNVLVLRYDIFPIEYKYISNVMYHSEEDILLTGDQSLTDALSCCSKKNIFYQALYHKKSFLKLLSKKMPNKYLQKIKTSCGTIKAIKYKSNYSSFVKNNDFRIKARPKMDAIMKYIRYKDDKPIKMEKIEDIILSSRTKEKIIAKLEELSS